MSPDPFLDEEFRVLTPEAFDFVLANELKRAVRSQNYLTLLVVGPTPADPGGEPLGGDVIREVTRLVSREVRETDLLTETERGQISIVLLDADLSSSMNVVDRLASRFKHYRFANPVAIEMGAACCPTHGADPETLRRAAEAYPVVSRREARGNASTAQ